MNEPSNTPSFEPTPQANSAAKRIADALGRSSLLILGFFLVTSVGVVLNAALPALVAQIVNAAVTESAVAERTLTPLLSLAAAVIGVPVLYAALRCAQAYLQNAIGLNVSERLRSDLLRHLLRAELRTLEAFAPAELLFRLTRTCGQIGEVYLAQHLLALVGNVLSLVSVTLIMLAMSWPLALIALMALPAAYGFTEMLRGRAKHLESEYLLTLEAGEHQARQVLDGVRLVRAFGGAALEDTRWMGWLQRYRAQKTRLSWLHDLILLLPAELVISLVIGVVIAVGAVLASQAQLSAGALIAIVLYIPILYAAMRQVLAVQVKFGEFETAVKSLDALFALGLDSPHQPSPVDPVIRSPVGMQIEFQDVSFAYGRDGFSLVDVSFTVRPGEFLGIVGTTGGGKSTLADLILGFYLPNRGRILVDGVAVTRALLPAVRARIAWVAQDTFLWDETVAYNLAYPHAAPDEARLMRVLADVRLDDLVARLPDGLQTRLHNPGDQLSGGERQRLALGRALLRDTDLILLDEPTAALDTITEKHIRQSLEAIRGGRTLVAIAHRLTTIMGADRVLVLEQGRVAQIGPPRELMGQDGPFRRLVEAQG